MEMGWERNHHRRQFDAFSNMPHLFKGIRWDVLYRLGNFKSSCWYLGFPKFDYKEQLSDIRYQFILLGKENEFLYSVQGKKNMQ